MQRSEAPLKELAMRYGLNQKTVAKWRESYRRLLVTVGVRRQRLELAI